ncbi:MAG: hypothetical protein MJZ65_04210 [Paludibacteraceae bacterium]|nr:hypothetical protein [Paludibacteraceae bacterium]
MKRVTLSIIALLTAWIVCPAQDFTKQVVCGTWVNFSAQPFDDFIFAQWSDGSTELSRSIEVVSDTVITAIFHDKCGDFANLPLVNRYDWILMLNVRKITTEMNYTLAPERVHWYRVVGDPDNLEFPIANDPEDTYLGDGYSFTLEQNLQNAGTFYAWVDLLQPEGVNCSGMWRTEVISFYSPSSPAREIGLSPNVTTINGTIHLTGLNPNILTHLRIYSITGQMLMQTNTIGVEDYLLHTYPATGLFEVQILSEEDNVVLHYLIKQ